VSLAVRRIRSFILTTALGIAGHSSQLLSGKLSVGIGSIRCGLIGATVGAFLVLFVESFFATALRAVIFASLAHATPLALEIRW